MDQTAVALRQALGIDELVAEVRGLRRELALMDSAPRQAWYNLKVACALKGVCYNSVKSRAELQPNGGKADATIGGRRVWRRETVEAWLGEVGPWYAENSNVTHAAKLQGKLMLTVGEMDRNVDPASTMQVVNALIKADKDFDLIVVPGANHGIGESPYMSRRRMDFFARHLLGVEPRQ